MIEIIFLGTGGSMPTEGRNLPAIAIKYQGWVFLLDCGEDVQRQFERAGLGLNKKMAVFISHMHADHILGLPGLLLRFSLLGRIKPLSIYGPSGLLEYVRVNQETIHLGTTFESTVYRINEGPVLDVQDISVSAFEVSHRGDALGYELIHKLPTGRFLPERAKELGVPKGCMWGALSRGEVIKLDDGSEIHPADVTEPPSPPIKIVYSGDTRECDALRKAATGANIFVCESMYTSEHENLANDRGHMTARGAAQIALDADVDLLVLTHYSPRYENSSVILDDARSIFSNSILARDMMSITIDKDGKYELSKSAQD
ncbi:MAG: ribonuclease Z [Candidatus Thorarchaeota archaeon]